MDVALGPPGSVTLGGEEFLNWLKTEAQRRLTGK
jgi:hypothetical protein